MLARQQRVLAPTPLFDRTIDHALCSFREFGQRDIQIIDIHGSNPSASAIAKLLPIAKASSHPRQAYVGDVRDGLPALGGRDVNF
jgi:hypothetical protein